MKGFFRRIINTFQQKPDLTQTAQFFKKVQGNQTQFQNASNPQFIDKIDALNRIIISGKQKDHVMLKIRQIVTETQLGHNISPKVQDACEVVHYALLNNTPVLISKIKLIHPEFDLSDQAIINESEFEKRKGMENPELLKDVEVESPSQNDYYEDQRHKWQEQQRKKKR